MLPAVWFTTASAVPEDEADFDDAGCTGSHEGVSEDSVDHGAERDFLWMSGHSPACEHDDYTWQDISSRSSAAAATEPDTEETRAPPDYAHSCMLNIVLDPGLSPPVFGESVDSTLR